MTEPPTGKLVIISGPSGAGKSTVVRRLLTGWEEEPGRELSEGQESFSPSGRGLGEGQPLSKCPLPLKLSVSATTRAPRPAERDGVDYHFLSKDEFFRRREAGDFLEWKEVFGRGDFYGTLRSETTSGLANGKWVILEIDVEGTLSVVQQHPEAVTIFVDPGSMEELERRLRRRGTESEESVQRRLEVARREMTTSIRYRFRVVNDLVDRTAREICDILTSYAGD